MKRANAVLFSLLMIVSSLAGCLGGEEVDTSEYEDKIAELEEMLDAQNQTIAQREATIDGLEDGMSDATQMIQDHAEGIAILEAYRDSLLVQLENSNNTSAELIVQLEIANVSIASMQSQIDSLESLRDSLSTMLNSSNSTIDELEGLLNTANVSILQLQQTAEDNRVNLSDADLSDASLRHAELNGADLSLIVWSNTICPDVTNSDDNGNTCENNL